MKFDRKLTLEDHVHGIVSLCLSQNWYFEVGEIYICGHLSVTSFLFYICSPNPCVWFPSVESADKCPHLLLEHQMYLVARLCPNQSFLVIVSLMSCGWV